MTYPSVNTASPPSPEQEAYISQALLALTGLAAHLSLLRDNLERELSPGEPRALDDHRGCLVFGIERYVSRSSLLNRTIPQDRSVWALDALADADAKILPVLMDILCQVLTAAQRKSQRVSKTAGSDGEGAQPKTADIVADALAVTRSRLDKPIQDLDLIIRSHEALPVGPARLGPLKVEELHYPPFFFRSAMLDLDGRLAKAPSEDSKEEALKLCLSVRAAEMAACSAFDLLYAPAWEEGALNPRLSHVLDPQAREQILAACDKMASAADRLRTASAREASEGDRREIDSFEESMRRRERRLRSYVERFSAPPPEKPAPLPALNEMLYRALVATPAWLRENEGQFICIRLGVLVGVYPTLEDALIAARTAEAGAMDTGNTFVSMIRSGPPPIVTS